MEVIKVQNVYKSFKVYQDKGATLKEKLLFKNRNEHQLHQVLKDININISQGDVVGLIGENGCGKSTLLKLMTKIIYPDKGSIQIQGKVSSLLELGAGFHPDMSGRENIYTNASIFGLTKSEIDERIERIIEFSELGEFVDSPVRTYSSGMYMRLAFSVAINVDADILLVDEILAVGDAAFQAKCFNKMQEIKRQGKTIVIVSHDLDSIERLCNRAIWIDEGKKKVDGVPHDIIPLYLDKIMGQTGKKTRKINNQKEEQVLEKTVIIEEVKDIEQEIQPKGDELSNRTGNKKIEITEVKMIDVRSNKETSVFKPNQEVRVEVSYQQNDRSIEDSVVGIGIFTISGIQCYGTNTYIDNKQKMTIKEQGKIDIIFSPIQLLEGEYVLDIAFHDEYGEPYDYIRRVKQFSIYNTRKEVGIIKMNHEFREG